MTMALRKARRRTGVSLGSGAVAAFAALALLLPAVASAHTGTATVSCTGADFSFKLFAPGSNTVHYDVTVDGASVTHADFVLDRAGGREGVLHVPLALTGTHAVRANAFWGPAGIADRNTRLSTAPPLASKTLNCPAPPPPPQPPPPPVAPVAPVAPAATPVATPPASAVAGVEARSPARIANIAVTSSCAARTARVTVTGRSMRDVTLFVNGRRLRTIRVAAGVTTVNASVGIARGRAQTISARVRFRNGARARTVVHRAVRCAAVAVQPQFTG
ncbi:MAG: hypothetical protein QOH72_4754 [Solirubrobacteraceae bacterium]|jgi:hypothetical protein|nr:hypothetical protein [Solirubrobacteraceae bacterium]